MSTAARYSSKEADVPLISVIISTRNNAATIDRCLESILAQNCADYELIVVNDYSTDETAELCERWRLADTRVQLISLSKQAGVAKARNVGIAAARGEILVFVDADTVCPPGWLAALTAPLHTGRAACTGGPDSAPPDDKLLCRAIDYSMHSLIGSGGLRRGDCRFIPFSPAGCNMALRRSVLDERGMFNEELSQRGEEKELEARIRRVGGKVVFVPEAAIWHYRRSTFAAFFRQCLLSGRARVDIIRLAPQAFRLVHFLPALVLALLMLFSAAAFWHPPLRPLFYGGAASYLLLLLIDGSLAVWRMRDWRMLFVVPCTSTIIPLAYGWGTLKRLLERKQACA